MLFWKDVGNGILLDRLLLFKLHESYRPLPSCIREINPAAKSGRDSHGNADLDFLIAVFSNWTKLFVLL